MADDSDVGGVEINDRTRRESTPKPAADSQSNGVVRLTRTSIPKFRKRDLMDLPEGTFLVTSTGEIDEINNVRVPSAFIHLPGINDTVLREEIWLQYKEIISGRMVHCFDNEVEMGHFWNDTGVVP